MFSANRKIKTLAGFLFDAEAEELRQTPEQGAELADRLSIEDMTEAVKA